MSDLRGARVGLLEARHGSDLIELVRRHGGEPVWAPGVREGKIDCGAEVSAFIDGVSRGACQIVVFQTGAGAKALFDEAERLRRLDDLVIALGRVTVVTRGPKPAAALSQQGVRASVQTREPHTTAEVVDAMARLEVGRKCVGLVHYGERNDALIEALRQRGARLMELQVYEWLMPDDVEPLRHLVREIVGDRIDAVAFTSQVQARHLFQVAGEIGMAEDLARALTSSTVVASVGPTCTAVLRSLGIAPHVEPERPKMRPLVSALAQYLHGRGGAESGASPFRAG